MSSEQGGQPRPVHVPTLTEVIEVPEPLTPASPASPREGALPAAPFAEPPSIPPALRQPEPGHPSGAPFVTGGLGASTRMPAWAPMSTLVLPAQPDAAALPPSPQPSAQPTLQQPTPQQPTPPPLPTSPSLPIALADLPVLDAVVPDRGLPAAAAPPLDIDEAQLAQRVLNDVQRQIDRMIDFRLKEAIAPILARHSDAMVRELREELANTMRDVVARSVAQEVAKLRQR